MQVFVFLLMLLFFVVAPSFLGMSVNDHDYANRGPAEIYIIGVLSFVVIAIILVMVTALLAYLWIAAGAIVSLTFS